jgi:hypothetical protein
MAATLSWLLGFATASCGVANAAVVLAKPHVRTWAGCYLFFHLLSAVVTGPRSGPPRRIDFGHALASAVRSHPRALGLFLWACWACWRDPVTNTSRFETRPGVYAHSDRGHRIAARAGLEGHVARAQHALWPRNGDAATITASLWWKVWHERTENLPFVRTLVPLCLPERDRGNSALWRRNYMDTFAVDWCLCNDVCQGRLQRLVEQHTKSTNSFSLDGGNGNATAAVAAQLRVRDGRVRLSREVASLAAGTTCGAGPPVRAPSSTRGRRRVEEGGDEFVTHGSGGTAGDNGIIAGQVHVYVRTYLHLRGAIPTY